MAFPQVYEAKLMAFSASAAGQKQLNSGGRVLLPPTVLSALANMSVVYPLQFEIVSPQGQRVYAAVLEFGAEMGTVILPDWMFQTLKLQTRTPVHLQTCNLNVGSILKLRPHHKAFVMIQDPRSVLERRLNNYPVLTAGTTIVIQYANRDFLLDVDEILGPRGESLPGILTVRADGAAVELKVEFERPLDMPPSPREEKSLPVASPTGSNVIGANTGGGIEFKPFDYKPPSLTTSRETTEPANSGTVQEITNPEQKPFSGTGRSLRETVDTLAHQSCPAASPPPSTAEDLRVKRLKAFQQRNQLPNTNQGQ